MTDDSEAEAWYCRHCETFRVVDGENLLGILDELEVYEVFADHFADIHVGDTDSDARREETAGFVERVRAWFT